MTPIVLGRLSVFVLLETCIGWREKREGEESGRGYRRGGSGGGGGEVGEDEERRGEKTKNRVWLNIYNVPHRLLLTSFKKALPD